MSLFAAAGPRRVRSTQSRTLAIVMAIAMIASFAAVGAAHAFGRSVTFCNQSTQPIDLAWAYDAVGTSETTSEGWKQVAACACQHMFSADIRATEFFFLALKSGTFDALLAGRGPLCVHPTNSFKFVNENNSAKSCRQAGGRWLNFKLDDAVNADHKINFTIAGGPKCNL